MPDLESTRALQATRQKIEPFIADLFRLCGEGKVTLPIPMYKRLIALYTTPDSTYDCYAKSHCPHCSAPILVNAFLTMSGSNLTLKPIEQ